jgi:hypothetical protein
MDPWERKRSLMTVPSSWCRFPKFLGQWTNWHSLQVPHHQQMDSAEPTWDSAAWWLVLKLWFWAAGLLHHIELCSSILCECPITRMRVPHHPDASAPSPGCECPVTRMRVPRHPDASAPTPGCECPITRKVSTNELGLAQPAWDSAAWWLVLKLQLSAAGLLHRILCWDLFYFPSSPGLWALIEFVCTTRGDHPLPL